MSRVPELTVYFWIIKVLTTGMGETTSDFFIHRVGVNNTVALAGIGIATGLILAISLALQLVERRYVPWIYWFAVVMVSVFGTMAADAVHIEIWRPVHRLERVLRGRPGRALRRLEREREDVVDPQHLHTQA